jgi:O-antigen ligase
VWELNPVGGVGAYNLEETMRATQPLDRRGTYLPAHNVYVVVLAELGIVGFVIYTLALLNPLRNLFSSERLLTLTAACLFGFSLMILFEFYYWLSPPMRPAMFWVLGMIWGLQIRQSASVEDPVLHEEQSASVGMRQTT